MRLETEQGGGMRALPAATHPCVLHRHHSPHLERTHVHHIFPLGWGGPDTADNEAPCCPTGHDSIHILLEAYRRHDGEPPWEVRKEFGPAERAMAAEGWRRSRAEQ